MKRNGLLLAALAARRKFQLDLSIASAALELAELATPANDARRRTMATAALVALVMCLLLVAFSAGAGFASRGAP